ncbi:putative pisatin demethylase [Diaporthe ampelina]|uniref:Putative pisatin demethylase n=1 Tax=Diaporthe ampelina TaxID=1214573 RepID=A0A0G2F6Z0_9PEZI|nr:putative pisatin demethylase [Diaporthe ampelina]
MHCKFGMMAIFNATELSPAALTAVGAAFVFILYVVRQRMKQSHIPGPFLASITNIPRMRWGYSGRAHEIHIELHKRYGNLVRLGPNCISVGDPLAIPQIYGTGANFPKSDLYKVLQPMAQGKVIQGIFNTQDASLHSALRRPISNIYSMSNLVEFEPYVDSTIRVLLRQLEEVQKDPDQAVDLGRWLQWFALDVMGEITFSKRLGFLDQGKDVDGIIQRILDLFKYASWAGNIPWIEKFWAKNPIVSRLSPTKTAPLITFALARARERTSATADGDKSSDASSQYNSRDFISRFLEARAKDPARIPEWFVTAWTLSNLQAGSDTTAITLRAVIYFLLRHPPSLAELMAELAAARAAGRLSDVATWKEARQLPFLDACIREAGRLHPATGLALERVVPAGGAEICGRRFAGGTVVGMNAWVVHRDKGVFGEDAEEWNPGRWLVGDEGKRRVMEKSLLTFGAGSRTCLGKNISHLEIYKLIPTLFTHFEMTLSTTNPDWRVANHWLAVQNDFEVHLRRRSEGKPIHIEP